jgi:hypothetical protein
MSHMQPFIELKTRPKFHPLSSSLSMDKVSIQVSVRYVAGNVIFISNKVKEY